jgi:hypothetical protein
MLSTPPGWWPELGSAVERVEPDLPRRGVDQGVVGTAEEHEVVEAGVAAVGPVSEVVGVAGEWHPAAAGEPAVLVAQHERFPDRCRHQALGATHVEHLAQRAEDGGDDLGVAGQPADGGDGEVVAGVEGRGPEPCGRA